MFAQILYSHQRGSFTLLLVCALKRKPGKRNFGYWFCLFLFSLSPRERWRTECVGEGFARENFFVFSRHRRNKNSAQSKSTLRFALHFRLCLGKADVAEELRLELLRGSSGFSPNCFLSYFLFKKESTHNEGRLREIFVLMIRFTL